MRRKVGFCLLSLVLSVLMAVLSPVQIFAASNVTYIKEVCLGYGEDGRQALVNAGYTIMENFNSNAGGNGSAVYLGYKSTDKKEEAITDFAVMPMATATDCGYSFEDYTKVMEEWNEQIDLKLEKFDSAIEEFRANFNKPAPQNDYALRAYKLLNMYKEEDTNELVGDLFIRNKLDDSDAIDAGESTGNKLKKVYHNILMMGNANAINSIQMALAIGCTETGGKTFLDKLKETEYTGNVDPTLNDRVYTISYSVEEFQTELETAKATYDYAESYKGGRTAYLDDLGSQGTDCRDVISQITLIDVMLGTQYAKSLVYDDKQLTFYDVMMLPTSLTAGNNQQLTLSSALLAVLAECMTPGQIAISEYTGLSLLIRSAYSTTYDKVTGTDGIAHFDLSNLDSCLEGIDDLDPVTVYLGVDRTVFTDDTLSVAVTKNVMESKALDKDFGAVNDYETSPSYNAAKIGMIAAGAVLAAAGLGMTIAAIAKWGKGIRYEPVFGNPIATYYMPMECLNKVTNKYETVIVTATNSKEFVEKTNALIHSTKPGGTGRLQIVKEPQYLGIRPVNYTTTVTKVLAVAGALFILAGIVLAIIGAIMNNKTEKPVESDYTKVPRALIDVKTVKGDNRYFIYYAAKTVNSTSEFAAYKEKHPDVDESVSTYGDLNGLNGKEPWLCLYYAKDMRIGSPITTESIKVNSTGKISTMQSKNGYVPIHSFSGTELTQNNLNYVAYNLNQTSRKDGADKIYVYFKRNMNESPLPASLFDDVTESGTNTAIVAAATFVCGAALASLATFFILKRKKKKIILAASDV